MMTNPYIEHSAAELKDQQQWATAMEHSEKGCYYIHRAIASYCGIPLREKQEFEESCCDPTVGYHYTILFDGEYRLNNSWVDSVFLLKSYAKLSSEDKLRFNVLFRVAEKTFEKEIWVQSAKYERALSATFLKLIEEHV